MRNVGTWLDTRTGLRPFLRLIFQRRVPIGLTWSYTLGSATLFVFLLQTVTGILLALNYSPSPDHAYDSIRYITNEVPFGEYIRGLHHWGASAMVVVVILHLITVFLHASFKRPREMTWLVGVVLLLITLGFGFTGYLLTWDQKAYWATTVGTNMPGTMPGIGSGIVSLLRGGTELGAVTLSRFYSVHVLLLPLLAGLFIFVHLVLVIWHGVGVPAKLWHSGLRSKRKSASIIGESPQPDITAALEPLLGMSPLTVEQEHERYLAFKARGPRFWPHVIGLDSIASLLVFMLLVVLTVTLGVPTESRADPTDTSYIPRPEWYFMSLFQLVKYFPGNLEWVGVIIIPSFFVLLLFLLPFISRKPERRPLKRPYGTGILTLILVGLVALTVLAYSSTPPSTVVENGNILTSQQLRGKQLVSQQGCTSCHVIGGQGGQKGPPLDGVGERMTAADIHFLMENPRALNPAASMQPVIPPLTHEDVEAITQYLVTLKGGIAK